MPLKTKKTLNSWESEKGTTQTTAFNPARRRVQSEVEMENRFM